MLSALSWLNRAVLPQRSGPIRSDLIRPKLSAIHAHSVWQAMPHVADVPGRPAWTSVLANLEAGHERSRCLATYCVCRFECLDRSYIYLSAILAVISRCWDLY